MNSVSSGLGNLVPEMPLPREHHGEAVFIGRGNDLCIAHGAARLDDGRCACGGERIQAVAEREERIRRGH